VGGRATLHRTTRRPPHEVAVHVREMRRLCYGDSRRLDELVSFAALESDLPSHPRAFIAAVVATESTPPWPPHEIPP
jgi:hypothetical protein